MAKWRLAETAMSESESTSNTHFDAPTVRSMSREADCLSGCRKSKRAEMVSNGFLIPAMGRDGGPKQYFDFELTEARDAELGKFSDEERRTVVARHVALREARFKALRQRLVTLETA